MTEAQWLELALKIVLPLAALGLIQWMVLYTRLQPNAWREPLGLTFLIKTLIVVLLIGFSILSVFFNLNRETSEVIGWAYVSLLFLIAPVMLWRSYVFITESRDQARRIQEIIDKERAGPDELSIGS